MKTNPHVFQVINSKMGKLEAKKYATWDSDCSRMRPCCITVSFVAQKKAAPGSLLTLHQLLVCFIRGPMIMFWKVDHFAVSTLNIVNHPPLIHTHARSFTFLVTPISINTHHPFQSFSFKHHPSLREVIK